MNKGKIVDLDTWIVPGQILKANLRRHIIITASLISIIIIIINLYFTTIIIIINRRSGITSHTSHGHKTGTRSMQPVRSVPLGGPVLLPYWA